jgi:hypothetical protein
LAVNPRLFLAGLLIMALAPGAAALTLGVHPEEPAPALGEVLAELADADLPLQLRPFPNQQALLVALRTGSVDAALIEAPVEPVPGVRLISDLYPSVLHILYPKAWGQPDLRTLLTRGSIWAGGEGSVGRELLQGLQADYMLPDGALTLLPDPISQAPEVWMIFGGILSGDALRRLPEHRLFDFNAGNATAADPGAGIAEGMALRYPQLHTMMLPRQLYPSMDSPRITTLAVSNQLVVREDLPVDTAFRLATLVDQARQAVAAAYPLAALDVQTAGRVVPHALPPHPGAIRFADRNEPSFLERYAEVFAFLLTALVALASAGVAIQRYRQQRRKDRLDRFFQRLLEQRDGDQPRAARAQAIRDLQTDVIELVVRERISADGALLAFMSLSNQLLNEAEQAAAT